MVKILFIMVAIHHVYLQPLRNLEHNSPKHHSPFAMSAMDLEICIVTAVDFVCARSSSR